MKKIEFRNFVKSIILEVKKEKGSGENCYLNGEKDKFKKDVDNKESETVHKLLGQIETAVKKIDKNISVILDDHNDIMVKHPGIFSIRVKPKWSGIFDVEAFRNMSDRVYAIGLDVKQVMNFIKVNFVANKKSYVQTAYDKSIGNLKDDSEKKAKELPKGNAVKQKEVGDKDKEDDVTDKKDEPDSPMKPVEDVKRQEDHNVEKNKEMPKIQKMVKKEVDDDLTKNWKK